MIESMQHFIVKEILEQQAQRNSGKMEDTVNAGMSKTMVRNSRQCVPAAPIIQHGNKTTRSIHKLFSL